MNTVCGKNASRVLASVERFVITEKSIALNEKYGQVVFNTTVDADKRAAKLVLEAMFGVRVKSIRSVVTKGRWSKRRSGLVRSADQKKMIASVEGTLSVSGILEG